MRQDQQDTLDLEIGKMKMTPKESRASESSTENGPSTKRQKKDESEENVVTKSISSKQPLKITILFYQKEGNTNKLKRRVENFNMNAPCILILNKSFNDLEDVSKLVINIEDDKED